MDFEPDINELNADGAKHGRNLSGMLIPVGLILIPLSTLVLDVVNFFTGGTACTWLILAGLYAVCGAVGAKAFAKHERMQAMLFGFLTGVVLAFVGVVVKVVMALVFGLPVTGLLSGVLTGLKQAAGALGISADFVNFVGVIPYFCLCGPLLLGICGVLAGFGGLLYGLSRKSSAVLSPNDNYF